MGEGASLHAEVRLGSAAVALERAGFRVTLTHGAQAGSFLRTARALSLRGPADWSARLDE